MAKQKSNPKSLMNIRRIDDGEKGGTHGYQVHIARQGKSVTRFFSDSVCGGKTKARAAAIAHRDELYKTLPPSNRDLGIVKKARSNTGHVGISKTVHRSPVSGKEYPVLSVHVRPASRVVKTKRFFYKKGEYKKTLEEALAWRNGILEARAKEYEASGGKPVKRKAAAPKKKAAKKAVKKTAKKASKKKAAKKKTARKKK